MMATVTERRRWLALLVLCLGDLMIVLDTTIVNVALPSIRADLGFSATSLTWVVNGYLLTFGGFLLLAGRMGDLFGHCRLFLIGLTVFTSASLACGLAGSPEFLVGARAVQGLGGAVVSVVALSLIITMFTEPAERAKTMSFIGFVIAGGGRIGVFLGGVLPCSAAAASRPRTSCVCCGRLPCSRGSFCPPSTCSWYSATARSGSVSPSCPRT
jgi:MFS family permease